MPLTRMHTWNVKAKLPVDTPTQTDTYTISAAN